LYPRNGRAAPQAVQRASPLRPMSRRYCMPSK
jgi:hypothetical protein